MRTYGRKTIYANYTEEELLEATGKDLYDKILDILRNAIPIHNFNKNQTRYLQRYYNGIQDIYVDKVKITRPEINNKTVENWAYALIDFKKSFLLGKPIQYVQFNSESEEEIAKLNQYVRYENKKAKDILLYEDILIAGRGFRYNNFDKKGSEDEAPFEIINVPNDSCEVVYSSQLGNKQLLSFIESSMSYIDSQNLNKQKRYREYTVYLRNMKIVVSDKSGELAIEEQNIDGNKVKEVPILLNEHIITEYYTNKNRISLIEIGKDLFNDINYLESLDKDDMEQFVNAIMVFVNAEVNSKELKEIREMGAVSIASTENKQANVYLLEQRLNAETTQTYYNRLLNALHQILGIPMASDNGSVSYGDTGQAKLTGQGFTSAGIRAETDETMFAMCDINSLKVIVKILKETANSGITKLKVSDIDTKFQRDMSDNLLVKTQALLNLYNADVPRKFANAIIGLFGDPNAVAQEQENLFGKQVSQLSAKKEEKNTNNNNTTIDDNTNKNNIANNQNNNITNTQQKDTQKQS